MINIELERIGVVGGGVNAALFCLEAKKKGIPTTILEPDMYCAAANIADEHLVAPINQESLLKLIHRTDAIIFTKKVENADAYKALLQEKIPAYPKLEVLEMLSSREKFLWKMQQSDLPVMPYKKIGAKLEMLKVLKDMHLPVSVTKYYKSEQNNKDFETMMVVSDEDIVDLLMDMEGGVDYWIVEDISLNVLDLSIAITNDNKNKPYIYSITEDIYSEGEWIQSYVPARITKTLSNKATSLAKKAIKVLGDAGTFTVKLGVTKDKEPFIREILPYAIENAVYTSEICSISQHDHLIRLMLGLSLFNAVTDGVAFVQQESEVEFSEFQKANNILSRVGTNVYSFKGKSDNKTIMYTFKADTWTDLEDNMKV